MHYEGREAGVFLLSKGDARMILRTREAELSGQMEYTGTPQPVVMPVTRKYENRIVFLGATTR